jgi:hypothetical protein
MLESTILIVDRNIILEISGHQGRWSIQGLLSIMYEDNLYDWLKIARSIWVLCECHVYASSVVCMA